MPVYRRSTGPAWVYDTSNPRIRYLELGETAICCLFYQLPNSGAPKRRQNVFLLEFLDGERGFHPSEHTRRFHFPVTAEKGAPAMFYKISEALAFAKEIIRKRYNKKR